MNIPIVYIITHLKNMIMKRLLLLGIALLVLCACGDSTTETAPVGIVPELAPEEEIVCPGTVLMLPNPPMDNGEILPGQVLGLRTPEADYILTLDGHWLIDGSITIADRAYTLEEGNVVKIIGVASKKGSPASGEYLELEIRRIE